MTKKYLVCILTALLFILIGCKSEQDIDYCQMLTMDQSFVNFDTSDMKKYTADRLKRKELIKNNFKELINYSSNNQFPEMGKLDVSGLDSCRNWAVFITCFHIGQIEPNLFFEKGTVEVLTREIQKGHLKSSSIFTSLREGFRDHEFCESKKDEIYKTLNTWQIQIDKLPAIRFIKCSS